MAGFTRWWIAAVACLLLHPCGAYAQQNGSPSAPTATLPAAAPSARSAPRPLVETPVKLYLLKDKDGNLVEVPGITLEDLDEAYRQQAVGQPVKPPKYSFQRLTISANAKQDIAELTVDVAVMVRDDEWVRVPLQLDQAKLQEATYQGEGEAFVHFEVDGEGHVAWIRGKSGQQHQLTLKMLVPLIAVGDQFRLKLLTPRATVSQMKLRVPLAGAAGEVSEGATLSTAEIDGNATEFTVLGLGGDFELTWRKPQRQVVELPSLLEAEGAVVARLGSRSVAFEATLQVRSRGAEFDRFRVRLPAETRYLPGNPTGYTVAPAEADGKPQPGLLEVRLAKKTKGAVEIRLAAERSYNPVAASDPIELAGFEVLNAAQQWGHISVAAESDWQVIWGQQRGVRRVDQVPDAVRQPDQVAAFEYFAQPFSLQAQMVPKKTRISVEPEYVVQVGADEVELDARLKYVVRGAKVFSLDVTLPDWDLVEVGPENLVKVDQVVQLENHQLRIPLAQPSTGNIELHIQAKRTLAKDKGPLSLGFPQPEVNWPGPSTVVILPADNVELIPDTQASTGLVRQQIGPEIKLPKRQQDPLFYRGDTADARFVANFQVRTQKIDIDVDSQLRLGRATSQLQQRLSYTIAHEPIEQLTLAVPRVLSQQQGLSFSWDNQSLTATPLSEGTKPSDDTVRMRLALPAAQIGQGELLIRCPITLPRLKSGRATRVEIPMAMPVEGNVVSSALVATAPAEIQMELDDPAWTIVEPSADTRVSSQRLQLQGNGRQTTARLMLRQIDGELQRATVVDRAWVQTWLTTTARQDRAVFSLANTQGEVQVLLPDGAVVERDRVLLDGGPAAFSAGDDGTLTVAVPANGSQRRHLLELWVDFPQYRHVSGELTLDIPRFGPNVWIRRLYWQLVLPQHEHVLSGPEGFTDECMWHWHNFFFSRDPVMEQSDLELWIGATQRTAVPSNTNRYLFSSFGPVERCSLRTASRSWLVLGASGAALVAGLLLIYVPRLRHPAVLFVSALGLLTVGIVWPQPALLVAQAASLGLALALFAGLLQQSMAGRRVTTIREPSSSIVERGSTRTQFEVAISANQLSTQTAPSLSPPPELTPPTNPSTSTPPNQHLP